MLSWRYVPAPAAGPSELRRFPRLLESMLSRLCSWRYAHAQLPVLPRVCSAFW